MGPNPHDRRLRPLGHPPRWEPTGRLSCEVLRSLQTVDLTRERFGYEPPAAATASSGRIFRLVMSSSTAPYSTA
jgi:hypothetical protein